MMKKPVALLLIIILAALILCGCEHQIDKEEIKLENDEVIETDGSDDPVSHETTSEELFDIAYSFIDRPVSELYEKIGKPDTSSYASSCMGGGQDGELYYDGFIVCTYLEGETETVVDVYK